MRLRTSACSLLSRGPSLDQHPGDQLVRSQCDTSNLPSVSQFLEILVYVINPGYTFCHPAERAEQLKLNVRGDVSMALFSYSALMKAVWWTSLVAETCNFCTGKDMLANLWRKVIIDAPSDEELAVIIEARFPVLSTLISKLIGTFSNILMWAVCWSLDLQMQDLTRHSEKC